VVLPLNLLCALGGCQWCSQSRFDACQAQNRTLNEEKKAQLAEIENLKIHAHNVEDQLIRAEEELAKSDEQSGPRYGRGNHVPNGISGRLADLARRYPSLQYDPKTGISKLDTDVLFASGQADLKPAAEKMLTEFAQILESPEAEQLKIMVVGHTDAQAIKGREVRERYPDNWHLSAGRALAVAQRLRQAGIPEDRMGIAGFGQHQPVSPNDTAESRQKNRRVEIFVVGPDTPVVGWTETLGSLYR
jgi:chemotaxis protein MotB